MKRMGNGCGFGGRFGGEIGVGGFDWSIGFYFVTIFFMGNEMTGMRMTCCICSMTCCI
jgi:hypothetical protein